MKKKLFAIIMCVMMVMCFMPSMTFAASTTDCSSESCTSHEATVTIDGTTTHYDLLRDAINAARSVGSGKTATITLLKDVSNLKWKDPYYDTGTQEWKESQGRDIPATKTTAAEYYFTPKWIVGDGVGTYVGNTVVLDLNGHDISLASGGTILVQGGTFEITGTGTISEADFYRAPVTVYGSTASSDENYSTLIVGEGVTLEGYSGIQVKCSKGTDNNETGVDVYGVNIEVNGKLIGNADAQSPTDVGSGIEVKSVYKNTTGNVPEITFGSNSVVTSPGPGIAAEGYAKWTLSGSVTGTEAIAIKSGDFTINGGTYRATGECFDPAVSTNGSDLTGAAISITSDPDYAGNISVTINSGEFISASGYAVYEGIGKNNEYNNAYQESYLDNPLVTDKSVVTSMSITGGEFKGNPSKKEAKDEVDEGAAIKISMAGHDEVDKKVVSGGTFSSLPSEYMTEGASIELSDNDTVDADTAISGKQTVTVTSDATLTIAEGKELDINGGAKLVVESGGELVVNGTLDMSGATPAEGSFALEISQGAEFEVNGTAISSSGTFGDVEQLGTLTITDSGKYRIKTSQMPNAITYIGSDGVVSLGENSKVVSVPNTAGTYENGYTYTLTGSATSNGFEIQGNDIFKVPNGATFNINKLTLKGAKENQLVIETGGQLLKGTSGEIKVESPSKWTISSGTFDFNPSDYLAANVCVKETKATDESSTWTVAGSHDFETVAAKDAKCGEDGNNEYKVCKVCGGVFTTDGTATTVEDQTIQAGKHELVLQDAKTAGCTTDGWKAYYKCKKCDACFEDEAGNKAITDIKSWKTTENQGKVAASHDWETNYTVDTAATCTTEGSESKHCKKCGVSNESTTREIKALEHDWDAWVNSNENQHTRTCKNNKEHTETADHNWDEGKITTAATCEAAGEKTFTCADCKATKTEPITALEHKLKKTDEVAATCTTAGTAAYWTCQNEGCEKNFSDETGEKVIDNLTAWLADENGGKLTATGHSYGAWTTTEEATCTKTGTQERSCTKCSDKETETIEELGHNEVPHDAKTASCTEKGWDAYVTCSRCDYTTKVEQQATGHTEAVDAAKNPTCTETGLTEGKHCSVCGEVLIEQTTTEATGHSWNDGEITTDATCEVDGIKTFTCTSCQGTKSETVKATGHSWESDFTVDKEATCTTAGSESIHCSKCDVSDESTTKEIAATGHSYGAWTTTEKATCTKTGTQERSCTKCGDKETGTIEALDHSWESDFTVDEEATCTTAGSKSIHCKNCEETKDKTTIDATGHSWNDGEVTTAATCEAAGVKTFTCADCKATKTEPVAAKTHSYGNWTKLNDDQHQRTCANDPSHTETAEHNWGEGVTTTPATCSKEGVKTYTCSDCKATKTETIGKLAHTEAVDAAQNPTCTETGLTEGKHCSVCGEVLIEQTTTEATGHSWNNGKITTDATCEADGIKTFTCTSCQGTKTETVKATGHSWESDFTVDEEATCTTAGSESIHCSKCDVSDESTTKEIAATGHSYGEWTTIEEATCTKAGSKERTCANCTDKETGTIDALGHDPVQHDAKAPNCTEIGWDAYETCSRCDYTTYVEKAATGHSWNEDYTVDKEPTCTEAGSKSKHCTVCNETKDITTINATGHSWNDGEVTTAATCEKAGVKTFKCKNCEATKTEPITALEHKYGEWARLDDDQHKRTCENDPSHTETAEHSWDNGVTTTSATCSKEGVKTYTCSDCGATKTKTIEKIAHTEAVDEAKAATCTETGLTEGKHCSVCGEVLIEQTTVDALDHKLTKTNAKASTSKAPGNSEYYTCTNGCGKYFSDAEAQTEIAKDSWIIDAFTPVATITTDGVTEDYPTITAAINAAGSGATIKLVGNESSAVTIDSGKNVKIDLTGKTISGTITNNGKLEIIDSDGNGKVTSRITNAEGATISITGGTFSFDPTEYVADGYVAVATTDKAWTVKKQKTESGGAGVEVKKDDSGTTTVTETTEDKTVKTETKSDGTTTETTTTKPVVNEETGTTTTTEKVVEVKKDDSNNDVKTTTETEKVVATDGSETETETKVEVVTDASGKETKTETTTTTQTDSSGKVLSETSTETVTNADNSKTETVTTVKPTEKANTTETTATVTVKDASGKETKVETTTETVTKEANKTTKEETKTVVDKTTNTVTETKATVTEEKGKTTKEEVKEVKDANGKVTETVKTEEVKTENVTSTEKTVTKKNKNNEDVVVTTKTVEDKANDVAVETKVEDNKAKVEAKIAENTTSGSATTSTPATITVDATAAKADTKDVKAAEVTLPATTVAALKAVATAAEESKQEKAVELKTDVATLKIDNDALKTLTGSASSAPLVLTVENKTPTTTESTSSNVKATFELTAKIGGDDAFKEENSDSNGTITIAVSYKPDDSSKAVKVYYVNGNTRTDMKATYKNGVLTWGTNHFSTFEVEEVEKTTSYGGGGGGGASSGSTVDKTGDTTKDTGDAGNTGNTGDTGAIDGKDSKATAAELIKNLSFKARSSKTKKGNIKVTLTVDTDDIKAIEDLGYTVKYKFYRSTKKSSGYKAKVEKTSKTYTNTSGKKGTKYYYKARVMVYDSEGKLIAKSELAQCKYASRTK